MGDRITLGIGLGVLAYTLFALHDASNKWLVATLPVWQVMTCRSATIVVAVLIFGRGKLVQRAAATPLKRALIARSLITMTAWLLYYTAARSMPLAQLMTLYYSAPLITMLLAIPLLGERINATRWIYAALGFTGVLVASDPFGVRFTLATGLVLAASAMWGYAIVLMRQIARRESSMLQMLYQNLVFLICMGSVTAFTWTTPSGLDAVLLVAIGILGGLGQFTLFEAVRLAPASVMSTVEYSGLVWAFTLGYLVWGDIPSAAICAGAALIAASGVFLAVMEHRAAKA